MQSGQLLLPNINNVLSFGIVGQKYHLRSKRLAPCPGARASLPALLGGMALLGPVMDEPWFPKSLKKDRSPKRHEAARGVLRPSPFAAKEGRDPNPRVRARRPRSQGGGKRLLCGSSISESF
jgi:hypothetical protein